MNLSWFFTVTATAIAIATASPSAMAQNPNQTVIDRYVELCKWLTDVGYTPARRTALRTQVNAYRQRGGSGQDQALIAQARQSQSGAGWSGIQSQINAISQESQAIMGSGSTRNSAAGRWEQRGGIVTEYDIGLVRVPLT